MQTSHKPKTKSKSFSLSQLAEHTGSELVGNPEVSITNIDTLEGACETDASFLANPRYEEAMKQSNAGVICVDTKTELVPGKNYLVSSDPSRAFQMIAELLLSEATTGFTDIHPSAVIHKSVVIDEGVTVGPNVVIDQHVVIGSGTTICAGASIGPGTTIGKSCTIHANVTIREGCELGNRVVLQPGVVIGSCGFGFTTDAEGRHRKLQQLGNVVIEDDVEIGANTTIDRARFKSTRIKRGTIIDNLVQIAHNVEVGEDNIIVSQTGIAGSSKTGKHVVLGGQAGVVGHVTIGDGVQIATRGGVSKSITKPGPYRGSPVMPLTAYNKHQVYLRKIAAYVKRIEELEKKLSSLDM